VTNGLHQVGVVLGIAQRVQRHDEVIMADRWRPTLRCGASVENPVLGLADGGVAYALGTALFPELENPVEVRNSTESPFPWESRGWRGKQEFIELNPAAAGGSSRGPARWRAAPGWSASTRTFRRASRRAATRFPADGGRARGDRAEEAKVDLDVAVGGLQAAQGQDARARPAQGIAVAPMRPA